MWRRARRRLLELRLDKLVTPTPPTQGGGGKEFKVETGLRRRTLSRSSRLARFSLSRLSRIALVSQDPVLTTKPTVIIRGEAMAAKRPDHETTSEAARVALEVALAVALRVALRAMAVYKKL